MRAVLILSFKSLQNVNKSISRKNIKRFPLARGADEHVRLSLIAIITTVAQETAGKARSAEQEKGGEGIMVNPV